MISLKQCVYGYTLEELIGDGGMATIYRATNVLGVHRAIKVLKPYYANDQIIRQRFEQEAQLMVRLGRHKNHICQVENLDITDDYLAIIMEYLEGQNLAAYLHKQGRVEPKQLVEWILPVLDAINYAHQEGVIHRDIKPSNLFLTNQGIVKILDFGIAKLLRADKDYTKTRQVIGSPAYLSPEQIISPKNIDHRSDIYSLGVTLWTLLMGRHPYSEEEDTSSDYIILKKIVDEPLPLLRGESAQLNLFIQKATSKDVSQRFQSCQEMASALQKAIEAPLKEKPTPVSQVWNIEKTILKDRQPQLKLEENIDHIEDRQISKVSTKKYRTRWLIRVLGILVLVTITGVSGYWIYGQYTNSSDYQYNQGKALFKAEQYEAAHRFFSQAADSENTNAQIKLGQMYEDGVGVDKDSVQSIYWYRRAAEAGSAEAQFILGSKYNEGIIVEQDFIQARGWFEKAAEQNYADAQYSLGTIYLIGNGVRKDYDQALLWYRKAAKLGNTGAQSDLRNLGESW